jgi:hypothetical protein
LKTDFEQWLTAQFADTGPFTIFIVLVKIGEREVKAVKSSYAQMIGADMAWPEMRSLLDSARTPWDGVGFFVGLGYGGGPLPDTLARTKLKEVEASVLADPLALNRGRLFDRLGRHLQVDQV